MGTIVVGVDGSAGGYAALRWALDEARLRGTKLRVVHVYHSPQLPLTEAGVGAAGPWSFPYLQRLPTNWGGRPRLRRQA